MEIIADEEDDEKAAAESAGPLVGRWSDTTNQFFQGRVIAIFPKHWYPEGPPDRAVRTCEELHNGHTAKSLLEVGQNGFRRQFELQQAPEASDILDVIDPTNPGQTLQLHHVSTHAEHKKSNKEIRSSISDAEGLFELRDAWTRLNDEIEKSKQAGRLKRQTRTCDLNHMLATNSAEGPATPTSQKNQKPEDMGVCIGLERFVVHPFSRSRVIWDVLSFTLVIYDMFMIPLDAFEPVETLTIQIMSWTTRLFWTLDFCIAFLKGYLLESGEIVISPRKCAQRYIKSWCILDLFIVAIDWAEVLFRNDELGYARFGRASRTIRVVRVVRLLRVFRMREVIQFVLECVSSQKVVVVFDLFKMLIVLVALGHIMACLWYQVGVSAPEDSYTWVIVHQYDDREMWERYLISLHWALSQFAGGMDEITPKNIYERLYAVMMFLLAFIVSLIFGSNLTSSMTQLNLVGNRCSQQLAVLREYLSQNGVPRRLMMRAQRNAQHALREQERSMPEENVQLLQKISEPLLIELHFEMYGHTLRRHPFFESFAGECPHVMSRVCHGACQRMLVSQGDVVFYSGESPIVPKMYIVEKGTLNYLERDGRCHQILAGAWVSEAALWTQWEHRGTFVATSPCRFCIINSDKFCEVVSSFGLLWGHRPAEQAKSFVDNLNNMLEADISDIDIATRVKRAEMSQMILSTQDTAILRPLTPLRSWAARFFGIFESSPRRTRPSTFSRQSTFTRATSCGLS